MFYFISILMVFGSRTARSSKWLSDRLLFDYCKLTTSCTSVNSYEAGFLIITFKIKYGSNKNIDMINLLRIV